MVLGAKRIWCCTKAIMWFSKEYEDWWQMTFQKKTKCSDFVEFVLNPVISFYDSRPCVYERRLWTHYGIEIFCVYLLICFLNMVIIEIYRYMYAIWYVTLNFYWYRFEVTDLHVHLYIHPLAMSKINRDNRVTYMY